ncbi:MAG: 2-oxoisovalerate dehydrogenase, component beta subunit [Ignavibacteria bacterium]|nr:2-oxoisovalerate dehydrogenase, component beta subunit [Ignavibacteria bacterium]
MKEIFFLIEEAPEGGFTAKALEHSIFTEGENEKELKDNINDAVSCHFEVQDMPKLIHLHYVKDETYTLARKSQEIIQATNLQSTLANSDTLLQGNPVAISD